MTSKLRSRLEFTCLGVAVATAPILGRLYLRLQEGAPLSGSDFIGALSDLGVSLIFAAALIGLITRLRVAAMLLVFIWCLFNYGSYEHIRELGRRIQDPAFEPNYWIQYCWMMRERGRLEEVSDRVNELVERFVWVGVVARGLGMVFHV